MLESLSVCVDDSLHVFESLHFVQIPVMLDWTALSVGQFEISHFLAKNSSLSSAGNQILWRSFNVVAGETLSELEFPIRGNLLV
jgi:hypothetical protein